MIIMGVSFMSIQTGNGIEYNLCDQFQLENLIDRSHEYSIRTDDNGWFAGGGYKQFDTSGKMPYAESAHAELLRIGSLDADGDLV